MKAMNKYYTPDIEEFHVGFEYEKFEKTLVYDNQWRFKLNKYKFNTKHVTNTFFNYNFVEDLKEDKIRVKYLDQEDIESLGFKYQKHNTYYKKLTDKILLRLETLKDNILLIEYFVNGSSASSFMVVIKNKSELKKLLKQLKIID